MSGNTGILCPQCKIGTLEVALEVQVEARLIQRPNGGYGIGSVKRSPAQIRQRLEHDHCDDNGRLILEGSPDRVEGEIVLCSFMCGFSSHVTDRGIEG